MREEVLKDSFFGRRKTSVLESTSYFRDRDLPASVSHMVVVLKYRAVWFLSHLITSNAQPASSVGPITGIEMNGNPELYYVSLLAHRPVMLI